MQLLQSGGKTTKLMRALMFIFFQPHVLEASSAIGSRLNPSLDENILSVCISKYILKEQALRPCEVARHDTEPATGGHLCIQLLQNFNGL